MSLKNLISFVQEHFGTNRGIPQVVQTRRHIKHQDREGRSIPNGDPIVRPPLPPWLEDPIHGRIASFDKTERISIDGEIGLVPQLPDLDKINEWGIDVIAYYLPYHFYQQKWGIYLRAHGIIYLASLLKGGSLGSGDKSLLEIARNLLFEHERFHFLAETACAKSEAVVKQAYYTDYFRIPITATYEESLANAYAYRHALLTASSDVKKTVFAWMKTQSDGYGNFDNYLRQIEFQEGKRRVTAYMTPDYGDVKWIFRPSPAEFLFSENSSFDIPTYIVFDIDLPWLYFVKQLPAYNGIQVEVHSREHPPAHIHIDMPIGKFKTKYEWPKLQPVNGFSLLSSIERRRLEQYIKMYADKIDKEVKKKFERFI